MSTWLRSWPLTLGLVCTILLHSSRGNNDIDSLRVSHIQFEIDVPAVKPGTVLGGKLSKMFHVKETRIFQRDIPVGGMVNFTRTIAIGDEKSSSRVSVKCTPGSARVVETREHDITTVFIAAKADNFPATLEVEYDVPSLWRRHHVPDSADLAIWPWHLFHTLEFSSALIRSDMPAHRVSNGKRFVMPLVIHHQNVSLAAKVTHWCVDPRQASPGVIRICDSVDSTEEQFTVNCEMLLVDNTSCVGFQTQLFHNEKFITRDLPSQCIDIYNSFSYDESNPYDAKLGLSENMWIFSQLNPLPCLVIIMLISLNLTRYLASLAHLNSSWGLQLNALFGLTTINFVIAVVFISTDVFLRMELGTCTLFFWRLDFELYSSLLLWGICVFHFTVYPSVMTFMFLFPFRWMAKRLLDIITSETQFPQKMDPISVKESCSSTPDEQIVVFAGVSTKEITQIDESHKPTPGFEPVWAVAEPSQSSVSRGVNPVLSFPRIIIPVLRCMANVEDYCVVTSVAFHIAFAAYGLVPAWVLPLYVVSAAVFYRALKKTQCNN